jgi:uncharacterized protein (DUF2062 family)
MKPLKRVSFLRRLQVLLLGLKRKILRDKLPPERVALGWAIGMFYGCVIPFGFQLILSIPTALALKASKIGASVGTLLTNPVSIWFIYPLQCYAANRLIGGQLTYQAIGQAMEKVIRAGDYATLLSLGGELVLSFFIGGFLLAALCVPVTYCLVKQMVVRHRRRKARPRAR